MNGYELRRSRRKTLSIEVTREGAVLVRAPLRLPPGEIDRFVVEHRTWLVRSLERQRRRNLAHPEPDAVREKELRAEAARILPGRLSYYAAVMGLQPAGVRITSARTRFGSCSAQNRICFSWRLMEYPAEAVDYVVVHELAHMVHKNHGPAFWALVETVLPDYHARRAMLRGD